MLHTKFLGNQFIGSGEDIDGFYHIWTWKPSWSFDKQHFNFISLYIKAHMQNLSKIN